MSPKNPAKVAVLGAGIMGSSVALYLARGGAAVTLFDAAPDPFFGASRWNEGKIHLGFLYAGDPSLGTARRIISGGLAFKPLVEDLLGCSIESAVTPTDDLYLIHKDSIAKPAAVRRYFQSVMGLLGAHADAPQYFGDLPNAKLGELSAGELGTLADTKTIVAGFRVPERSVSTLWIGDRYIEALADARGIELALLTKVNGVKPADGRKTWFVETDAGRRGPFDYVVNALWHGKLAVDVTAGLHPRSEWSHRYRLSLFVRTKAKLDISSAVIATGPFGDIKNYTGQDFYLSWYDAGLVAQDTGITPPEIAQLNGKSRKAVINSVFENLTSLLPPVAQIKNQALDVALEGGWVFAMGQGALDNPAATLHRRDRIGVKRLGSYISVDTGKYSIAPWLAHGIAADILQ